MRSTEPLRLALIGLLALLLQLAWYMKFPGWRDGFDLYIVFLLFLAAARGPQLTGLFALAGGLVMDAFSPSYPVFHLLYYMVPVVAGSIIRSQLIVEYNLLGTLAVAGLLAGKIVMQLVFALALGLVDSPALLFAANYWSVVFLSVLVFGCWRWLIRLIPTPAGVSRVVG
jgi:hypothetical protein